MTRSLRIGFNIGPFDPFWVEVREAAHLRARHLGFELVPYNTEDFPQLFSEADQNDFVEDLLSQDLDALIGWWNCPEALAYRVLNAGLPIIHHAETNIQHPLSASPLGLYAAAHQLGTYLSERLAGGAHVLILGGQERHHLQDDGRSRIQAFCDVFGARAGTVVHQIPAPWGYDPSYQHLTQVLQNVPAPLDAMVGLSDSVALAGYDAALALGRLEAHTLIGGINGDPPALNAIAQGRLTATIETSGTDLGQQMVELAFRAAQGLPLPPHFYFTSRLVTIDNVREVAAEKLFAIANLPDRLVGLRRREQQERLKQLETSLEISRQVGSLLYRVRLTHDIAALICASYGYDRAQIFTWSEPEQRLVLEEPEAGPEAQLSLPLAEAGVLAQAVQRNEVVFIADTRHSPLGAPDPRWPNVRSRVILPIQFGQRLVGLLDLHSERSGGHTRQELVGLQSLAAQLGTAMRNAELYTGALEARARAEQADRLKTRLLANVSHELRTPLNVILGYTRAALEAPAPAEVGLPPARLKDLQHIQSSAEHLLRVINDLLDLSRAEIDELAHFPEVINTQAFVEEVFQTFVDSQAGAPPVAWRMALPAKGLPPLTADPVRLRQILFNLLSNAAKFTERGEIVLGAEVTPPHLHLWVSDSGPGIAPDLRERIFEPFIAASPGQRRVAGIGLGLSITRRLVALHRGVIRLESELGQGSTFHVYLPLAPGDDHALAAGGAGGQAMLLWVSAAAHPSAEVIALAQQFGGVIRTLRTEDDLPTVLADGRVVAVAWDAGEGGPGEADLLHRLYSRPELAQVPFFLGPAAGQIDTEAVGYTNLVVKPVSGASLLQVLRVMRPTEAVGPLLIVDDQPEARALYESIVVKGLPGHPVRTVPDGAAALTLMTTVTPSAVVLDLLMPGINGFEVLDWMRSRPQTRRVPVLVLSGFRLSSEDLSRLEQHSLVAYQTKGILSEAELTAALQDVVADHRRPNQPTSALAKRAIAYLQQHYARSLSRAEVAGAIGVSENYLSGIFRRELGLTPWDYLNRYRVLRAKELLRHTSRGIADIAAEVGFDDPAYFSRVFRGQVGQSPRAFRETAA